MYIEHITSLLMSHWCHIPYHYEKHIKNHEAHPTIGYFFLNCNPWERPKDLIVQVTCKFQCLLEILIWCLNLLTPCYAYSDYDKNYHSWTHFEYLHIFSIMHMTIIRSVGWSVHPSIGWSKTLLFCVIYSHFQLF